MSLPGKLFPYEVVFPILQRPGQGAGGLFKLSHLFDDLIRDFRDEGVYAKRRL